MEEDGGGHDWASVAEAESRLSAQERGQFRSVLGSYLVNSWIFRWIEYDDGSYALRRYEPIYRLLGRKEEMDQGLRDAVQAALNGTDVPRELIETIVGLFDRLSRVVHDGYDVLQRALFDESGQHGHDSMTGIDEPVNLIPGDGTGRCARIAIALVKGTGEGKYGFVNVMRDVRSHLIHCYSSTKVVVLLTDVWDPKLIAESRSDIAAHRTMGHVVVPAVASGGRLIPMTWPD
jgi:hypothetical protein